MGVEITEQLWLAALSVLAGAALALLYDIGGVFRRNLPEWLGIIGDGIFLFLAALCLFALAQGAGTGEFRLFMLAASLAGALLYRALFMRPVRRVTGKLAPLFGCLRRHVGAGKERIGNFFKNIWKNCKKVLSKMGKLVYNNKDNTKGTEQ